MSRGSGDSRKRSCKKGELVMAKQRSSGAIAHPQLRGSYGAIAHPQPRETSGAIAHPQPRATDTQPMACDPIHDS